ncbi:MAG: Hpt domain-containing protein [Candidatus Coproplasma sp.]
MNIEEFYKKLGGDYSEVSARLPSLTLVERFIGKFLQDKSFEDLSVSMKIGDRKGAFSASHTLKGVCANLGFGTLRSSSSRLCEELRGEGEIISDTAYILMNEVERDYSVVIQTISQYLKK